MSNNDKTTTPSFEELVAIENESDETLDSRSQFCIWYPDIGWVACC